MGIKLKWFRHRLTFPTLPADPTSTNVHQPQTSAAIKFFRRSKSESVLVTGYYRHSSDGEFLDDNKTSGLQPTVGAPTPTKPFSAKTDTDSFPTKTLRTKAPAPPVPGSQPLDRPIPPKRKVRRVTNEVTPEWKVEHEETRFVRGPGAQDTDSNKQQDSSNPPQQDIQAAQVEVKMRHSIAEEDIPPPLPTSPPPEEDPKPWYEMDDDLEESTIATPIRADVDTLFTVSSKTHEPLLGHERRFASDVPDTPEEGSQRVVHKKTNIMEFLGLSQTESPEPKSPRIRVPKKKSPERSPKPLPRTISLPCEKINSPPGTPSNDEKDFRPPQPPKRKNHSKTNKTLSFAETATIFSEEEDKNVDFDTWDLVAKHRANITQPKALTAVERPLKPPGTDVRVDVIPLDRPKTMREMRRSQSVGAGVNLKNRLDDSDTDA